MRKQISWGALASCVLFLATMFWSGSAVLGYDITEFPVCTDGSGQIIAAVGGHIVVWNDSRNPTPDIFGQNLAASKKIYEANRRRLAQSKVTKDVH